MIALDILWWIGLAFFGLCAALPLLLLPHTGPVIGVVALLVGSPWSALLGVAAVYRAMPNTKPGTFRMFADRGAVVWALKGWGPALYMTVFQPLFFLSPGFQRVVLRAFGARIARTASVTSRTSIREPQHLQIGAGSVIGEYVHFVAAFQPRPGRLVIGDIRIGNDVLVGGYSHIAGGAVIGSGVILEHAVNVGPFVVIGDGTRIGAGTAIYSSVRIGSDARIGKGCILPAGTIVPDGARIPDGTIATRVAS